MNPHPYFPSSPPVTVSYFVADNHPVGTGIISPTSIATSTISQLTSMDTTEINDGVPSYGFVMAQNGILQEDIDSRLRPTALANDYITHYYNVYKKVAGIFGYFGSLASNFVHQAYHSDDRRARTAYISFRAPSGTKPSDWALVPKISYAWTGTPGDNLINFGQSLHFVQDIARTFYPTGIDLAPAVDCPFSLLTSEGSFIPANKAGSDVARQLLEITERVSMLRIPPRALPPELPRPPASGHAPAPLRRR